MNENSINKIEYPEGVVNPVAYKKYLALKNVRILKYPYYVTSEGEEISLLKLPHLLRKSITHLSKQEQENIVNLKTEWNRLNMKMIVARSTAYGKQGKGGCLGKANEMSAFEQDIIELLGKMFTVGEIVKIMHDNGVVCSTDQVKYVLKKHFAEIEKKRSEFRDKVTDVRLYNKRPRLEELAWMYNQIKTKYLSLKSMEVYNSMLKTLEQIRKEAEGDTINFNGTIDVNIDVEIQAHIQKEILQTINLKEVILGRSAARMNLDLSKLIASLHNSYYAKFVDISGQFDPNAEMKYPSQENYDFTKIQSQADKYEKEEKETAPEPLIDERKVQAQNIKDLFLKKIQEQKDLLKKSNSDIQVDADILRERSSHTGEEKLDRGQRANADRKIFSKSVIGKKMYKGVEYKPEIKK